jgi:hypothetical protein
MTCLKTFLGVSFRLATGTSRHALEIQIRLTVLACSPNPTNTLITPGTENGGRSRRESFFMSVEIAAVPRVSGGMWSQCGHQSKSTVVLDLSLGATMSFNASPTRAQARIGEDVFA